MGRQVEAQLEDLALAGCTVRIDLEVNRDEEPVVFRYAFVTFPDGSGISSYHGECLVFDCRNRQSANFWALEQLIDLGVPFRWS